MRLARLYPFIILLAVSLLAGTPQATYNNQITRTLKLNGIQKLITPESYKVREAYLAKLTEQCKIDKCVFSVQKDSHFPAVLKYFGYNSIRVTYPDGWWMQVGFDSGVLEFQTRKSTLAEYKAKRDIIQRNIFDLAAEVGLRPDPGGGGAGHISYDIETTFEGQRPFARNMLVDEMNNSFLGNDILGPRHGNNQNAPSIAELPLEQQEEFRKVLREFDHNPLMSIGDLYAQVRSRVYTKTVDPYKNPAVSAKPKKYQAIALWTQRVEDRRYGPARDADSLIAQIEIKRKRMEWIKEKTAPIEFNPILARGTEEAAWAKYLQEMGAEPQDHYKALFGYFRNKCDTLYANVKPQ